MPPTATAYDRNLPLFYAFRFLREAQIWIPVWIVFLTIDRGFSLSEVAAAEAAFLIGITVLEVPTGAVADRFGRRVSLALGAAALIGAIVIFGFTNSFPVLLASFLLWAVADTLMSGADLALIYDTLCAQRRPGDYERLAGRGEAAGWAGATLGVLIGGPVAAALSAQFTIFTGAATTAAALAVALAMAEAPRHDPEAETLSYVRNIGAAFRIAWRTVPVRWMIAFAAALEAGMGATIYLIQPFLLDKDVSVGFTFSLLQAPLLAAGAGGALVAYRLAAHFGEPRLFGALWFAGVASYTALALIDRLGAIAFLPVLMLLRSAANPIATGYLNRRIPAAQRATILSMLALMIGLVQAPIAIGVGVTFDQAGLAWAFVLGGIVLGAAGLAAGIPWLVAHERSAPPPLLRPALPPPTVIAPPLPPQPGDPGG